MTPFQQRRTDQGKRSKNDQRNLSQCTVCGKFHDGEYRKAIGLCYRCGKHGHFIKNCSEAANDPKKPGGRLYALADVESGIDDQVKTEANPSVIIGEVFIYGIVAYALQIQDPRIHMHH